MLKVTAYSNEHIDQLLKRFKKLCEKEGLVKQMKKKAHYEKPSEVRRRTEKQTLKRLRKLTKEREMGM